MPTLTIPKSWSTNESPLRSTDLNSNFTAISTLLNSTGLDTTNLQTGIITNAYVNSAAAIATSKLAATTPGYVLVGYTTTGVPTFVAVSGDISITGAGVASITADSLVNADINSAAGIAHSKLAATTAGYLLMGTTTTGVITGTALSGDATITGAGVMTIANNAITTAKILDSNVTTGKIADDAVTSVKMSATSGEARMSTAFQGITASFVDVAGLDTGTITAPKTGYIELDFGAYMGGAVSTIEVSIRLTESVNGGAVTNLNTTYGGSPTSVIGTGITVTTIAAGVRRPITAGSTYRYKVQVTNSSGANGNIYQNLGTRLAWRIIT